MARPKEFNQDEVLSKAIQIFWIKGYSATTLQDLVDGLGISRSSLYGTYTDKHTLFVSALASYQQSAAAKISHITENTVSAKETVLKLLSFTMNALSDDLDHRGCFMVNSEVEMGPHDAEVSRLLCRNDLQMEEALY